MADGFDQTSRRPPAPSAPVLHVGSLEGPLDWLLDLAERQHIDLGRLPLVDLAEQLAAALSQPASEVPIERRADWLVMATKLLLLRAQLLFPAAAGGEDEAEPDGAAELRRLRELATMRQAATWLDRRQQLGRDVFCRGVPSADAPASHQGGGYVALMEACLAALRGRAGQAEAPPVYQAAIPPLWRLSDAVARIEAMLAEQPGGDDLLAYVPPIAVTGEARPTAVRAAVASTFAAALELARDGRVTLDDTQAETIRMHASQAIAP